MSSEEEFYVAFYFGLSEQIKTIKSNKDVEKEFNKNPLEYLDKILKFIKEQISEVKL